MKTLPFIPKYNGNREKPPGKRIVANITPLNYEEMSQYTEMSRTWKEKDPKDEKRVYILNNENRVQADVLKEHLSKIDNYSDFLTDDPITTAEGLLNAPGDWPLVTEIVNAIYTRSVLEEGLEKNLKPPSVGLNATSLNGGIAKSAERKI